MRMLQVTGALRPGGSGRRFHAGRRFDGHFAGLSWSRGPLGDPSGQSVVALLDLEAWTLGFPFVPVLKPSR